MPGLDLMQGMEMETEVTQNIPNLKKLLRHTKYHPKGRAQLDENGEIKNPRNNILYYNEKPIYIEDTQGRKIKIGDRKIPVNGGHVRAYHPLTGKQDSVWRIALGGPKRYHELCIKQAEVRARGSRFENEQVAPDLEQEEAFEYAIYRECLIDLKKRIVGDKEFYEWVRDKHATINEEGTVIFDNKKSPFIGAIKEMEKYPIIEPEQGVATVRPIKRKRGRPAKYPKSENMIENMEV